MKKLFSVILFSFLLANGFTKELEGVDLAVVHRALNAKLTENCFETSTEMISFLESELSEIQNEKVSDEARLISTTLLKLEIESVKTTEAMKTLLENNKGKKNKMKFDQENLDPVSKEIIMGCFEEYQIFANENEDLSSYFYFHYNETMYATVPYLPKKEQTKIMTGIINDYKKLEERNPEFPETLNMLGSIQYFMPGIFGGNKKAGEEKIKKAVEVASCDYEKVNALVLYAQLLFEKKDITGSQEYMNQALELSPENKYIQKIRDANNAGYSFFKIMDYEKSLTQ